MSKGLSFGEKQRRSLRVMVYAPIPLYATAVMQLIEDVYTSTRILTSLEDLPAKASDDSTSAQEVLLVIGVPRAISNANVSGYFQEIVRKAQSRPAILLHSDKNPHHMLEALKLGFRGYLFSPHIDRDVLVSTIWLVARGMVVFNAAVTDAQDLVAGMQRPSSVAIERDSFSALSPREQEVYFLLGSRLTNREIASQLGVGIRTIQAHVGRVAQKLGVRSRTDVVIQATIERNDRPQRNKGLGASCTLQG